MSDHRLPLWLQASGILVFVFVVPALAGCSTSYRTACAITGAKVTENQTFSVRASSDCPSTLIVEVTGEVDGIAAITTHDGRVTSIGPGAIAETIGGDYFEEEATIGYSPGSVKSGKLTIRYSFY